MAISDALKAKLNKMCITAKDALLGTVIQTLENNVATAQSNITALQTEVARGKHTVEVAEQTAGTVTIDTGITVNGFIVQVYRAGILLSSYNVTASTTFITVATNSTNYVVTENDVINYIVF